MGQCIFFPSLHRLMHAEKNSASPLLASSANRGLGILRGVSSYGRRGEEVTTQSFTTQLWPEYAIAEDEG